MEIKKQHLRIDRQHARISIELPCQVGNGEHDLRDAKILNLSSGGLKFACGHALIEHIIPEDQRIPGQIMDVTVVLRFVLQTATTGPVTIQTRARIIHSERLAQDSYNVGVQFLDMSRQDQERITTFVEVCTGAGTTRPD